MAQKRGKLEVEMIRAYIIFVFHSLIGKANKRDPLCRSKLTRLNWVARLHKERGEWQVQIR